MNQTKGLIVLRPPLVDEPTINPDPLERGVNYAIRDILHERADDTRPLTLAHAQHPSENTSALIARLRASFGERITQTIYIPLLETDTDTSHAIEKSLNTHTLDHSLILLICSINWIEVLIKEYNLDIHCSADSTLDEFTFSLPPHLAVYTSGSHKKRHP